MGGYPEGPLKIEGRIVSSGEVRKRIVTDCDIAVVGMSIFPDAEYDLWVGGLGIEDIGGIAGDQQAVVYISSAGIGLHTDGGREISSIAHAVSRNIKGIVGDGLVGPKGVMDTDVLIDIRWSYHRVEVRSDIETVVGNQQSIIGI